MKKTLAVISAVAFAGAALATVRPEMTVDRPGAVKPAGWVLDRAAAARDGFTGHMDEIDEHFRLAWTTNCMRRGKFLNWPNRHQGSWSAEGGAYWFDGLVNLAWQLDDPALKDQAKRRLEPLLANVTSNSVGFLWWLDRRDPKQVEEAFADGAWRFWVIGMAERVISAYYEATGDERARRALENAFAFEAMARRHGANAPFASGLADACRLTGSPSLARCLDVSCAKLVQENSFATPPWNGLSDTLNLRRHHTSHYKMPSRHGVWCAESLLSVLAAYRHTGERKLLDSVLAWYGFFDRYCGQPYGVTMMDEEWGWAGARRGTETCDVAAEPYARLALLATLGDGKWGDDAELAFFNAGPACVSRDFRRHVYFQLPNRVGSPTEAELFSITKHEQTRYQDRHWPLCCSAALNRILPMYIRHQWMKTADGGVAATLYGPGTYETELPVGRVAFDEKTDYPFAERIVLAVKAAPGQPFPLKVRVPGWCAKAAVAVNGAPVALAVSKGFATLTRAWRAGDEVTLDFPMRPVVADWRDWNEAGRNLKSIFLGPLLFAAAIPEKDDNTPAGDVREIALSSALRASDIAVSRSALPRPWDWRADAPVRLSLADAIGQPLELVPYGCTKLRLSAFPVAETTARSEQSPYVGAMATAVSAYTPERIEAMIADVERRGISEHGFPRFAANLGVLVARGLAPEKKDLLRRLMDLCAREMPQSLKRGHKSAGNDFSVKEIACALVELERAGTFPKATTDAWRASFAAMKAADIYSCQPKLGDKTARNWCVFGAASEQARLAAKLGGEPAYVEQYVADQLRFFDANGMYRDPGQPTVYDLVTRLQFAAILAFGYDGPSRAKLEAEMLKSAEPTLRMLSVTGEIPYGGRSNQFLHNEMFYAALCEWYARWFNVRGDLSLASRFRAAAARATDSFRRWTAARPVRHVKNRYPTEKTTYGCENYAYFDKYMVTAGSWAYLAERFADPLIPCAAAVAPDGTFRTSDDFHRVMANVGDYTVQFDWNAQKGYDANGLGRLLRRGAPSAICLSTPCPAKAHYFMDVTNDMPFALAPLGWMAMRVTTAETGLVELTDGRSQWSNRLAPDGLAMTLAGSGRQTLTLPAFAFDGETHPAIACDGRTLSIAYAGWTCRYETNGEIVDTGRVYGNRNGHYRRFDASADGRLTVKISIVPVSR